MPFFLAGRPTLVLLAYLAFFFFFFLSPSRPYFQSRNVVHLQPRQFTVTTAVTTTTAIRTTSTITTQDIPSSSTIPTHSASVESLPLSSSISLASSSSSAFSSTFASFSSSSSSSSHSKSTTHISSLRTPTIASPVFLPTSQLPTPATTLFLSNHIFSITSLATKLSPSLSRGVPSSSSSAVPVQATSSGFWSNKGAVGGTFAVVGLIVVGIAVFLFVTCVKKRRARTHDEELFSGSFDRGYSQHASTADAGSLSHPAIDPFAAGEVVQVRGSPVPFAAAGGIANDPSGSSNRGHSSSEDTHTSSNHHGFSNISYYTTLPDSRGNLNQPESPLFYQPQKTPTSASSYRPGHLYDPPSHPTAVPLSPRSVGSTYTISSPYLGAGQVNNSRQPDSDASYYADQIHSYYYGAGATAPPPARTFSQAI